MAMKWLPALSAPTACFVRSKKYCLKMLGSSVLPDLLETMKSVSAISILFSNAFTCAGSVESRTCKIRISGNLAERHAQNFRTQARSAHAEQKNVLEAGAPDFLGKIPQLDRVRDLFFGNVQPAQPVGLIVAGPQRRVALPKALHLVARLPIADGGLHRRGEGFGQRSFQAAQAVFPLACVLFLDRGQQFVECIGKQLHSIIRQLGGHFLDRDAGLARLSITFCAPATSSVRLLRSFP